MGGAKPSSTGFAVMNGTANKVLGFNPSNVMPQRGVEVGHVRTNTSVKMRRFCNDLSDSRIEKSKDVRFRSLQGDWIVHGSDITLGGMNVRP